MYSLKHCVNVTLCAGGCDPEGKAINVVEVFSFADKSWHQLPNMPTRRAGGIGLVFHEGKMILIGGVDENQVPIAAVDAFNIAKETWEQLPSLPVGVTGPYVIKIKEKIYVFGGTDKKEANQSVVFDLDRNEWSPLPPMPTRRYASGGYLRHNKVYIIGGRDGKDAIPACEVFDLATQQWEGLAPLPSVRVFYNIIGYKDHIYVIGGLVPMIGFTKIIERYSIKENSWTRLKDLSKSRSDGSVGVVGDHVVVAAGLGMSAEGDNPELVQDVLAFSNRGRRVEKLPPMLKGRTSTTTVVFEGKMAVIGGAGEGGVQKRVEILSVK